MTYAVNIHKVSVASHTVDDHWTVTRLRTAVSCNGHDEGLPRLPELHSLGWLFKIKQRHSHPCA